MASKMEAVSATRAGGIRRCGLLVAIGALLAAASCSAEREQTPTPTLVTWKGEIEGLVQARCATAGCHAEAAPAATYNMATYNATLGGGRDATANAIAGDATSLLLTVLNANDATHASLVDVLPKLQAWVVDSQLAYGTSPIHEPGLLNPADARFHGKELLARKWDFKVCQSCHGDNFAGGTSGVSCLTCHKQGPQACDTCHGVPPTSGAHKTHVARGIACAECHTMPGRWNDAGHILTADGDVDPAPAEVALGALAARDTTPPHRTGVPAFDAATQKCSNVYCHGGALGDAGASNNVPAWNAGPAAVACGSCHGKPPTTHAQSECVVCHPSTVASDGTLSARHIDGAIDIGDGSPVAACTGCHGSGGSAAPPRGLHGETLTSQLAVGAHRAHLDAPSGLRGPIACSECHIVPATIGAAGHIDSALPAEVFPTGAGTVARADGAVPAFNPATGACSGVYCHGNGARMSLDLTPGVMRSPIWNGLSSQIACGTCHGVPPTDAFHNATMRLSDCTTCHPSVDANGNIVLTGPPNAQTSEHLNGVINFR